MKTKEQVEKYLLENFIRGERMKLFIKGYLSGFFPDNNFNEKLCAIGGLKRKLVSAVDFIEWFTSNENMNSNVENLPHITKEEALTSSEPDLEQRRYEIAKELYPFFIQVEYNQGSYKTIGEEPDKRYVPYIDEVIAAKNSVLFADALITELKK